MTRLDEITPGFAPIEIYQRDAKRGAYTDVYSLAATLYSLLTGKVPEGAKERKFDKVRLTSPRSINDRISDRTNRAILAGMELEPQDRPKSIQEWLNLLGVPEKTDHSNRSTDQSSPRSGLKWDKIGAIGQI